MKNDKLKPGQRVQISKGHKSGLGGRQGTVVALGMQEEQSKAQISVAGSKEPMKVFIELDSLEELKSDTLPPGWLEFYI
ncbi:hypothetical protein [Paenibacillus wynnii]|uniref:KOW domain-containing protein n=1 Tax=Paenibacillus wynnii TaxID=268407 RepID=A0A098M8W6_9BACL|nr:hypothetical protein [Paenibacillus wynnii]KGE18501.1 hypothetical protein PWYN_03285 [Paenibacillus wynnii]